MKEAVAKTLREERDLLYEVISQVLEDFALSEAICEGRGTEFVDKQEILICWWHENLLPDFP